MQTQLFALLVLVSLAACLDAIKFDEPKGVGYGWRGYNGYKDGGLFKDDKKFKVIDKLQAARDNYIAIKSFVDFLDFIVKSKLKKDKTPQYIHYDKKDDKKGFLLKLLTGKWWKK